MFYDYHSSFENNVLNNFIVLINSVHESINLHWITNLNTRINYLTFEFIRQHMSATSLD
jgi:hypothetical protein